MAGIDSKVGAVLPGPGIMVPITSFAPEPYDLLRHVVVVVQPTEGGHTSGFFDANIHASGETASEAINNLKSYIGDIFEEFLAIGRERLGPGPSHELTVLQRYIQD